MTSIHHNRDQIKMLHKENTCWKNVQKKDKMHEVTIHSNKSEILLWHTRDHILYLWCIQQEYLISLILYMSFSSLRYLLIRIIYLSMRIIYLARYQPNHVKLKPNRLYFYQSWPITHLYRGFYLASSISHISMKVHYITWAFVSKASAYIHHRNSAIFHLPLSMSMQAKLFMLWAMMR